MNIIECLSKANKMTVAYSIELRNQTRQGFNQKKGKEFRFQLFTEDQLVQFETPENLKLFEACTEDDKSHLVSIFCSVQCNGIKLTPQIFHDCCEFPDKVDLACILDTMNDGNGFKLANFEMLISKEAPHYPDLQHHPLVHELQAPLHFFDPNELKAVLKETKIAIESLKRKISETKAAPSLKGNSLFNTSEEPNEGDPPKTKNKP
jgi:hypothetical protein